MATADIFTLNNSDQAIALEFTWGASSAARWTDWQDGLTIGGNAYAFAETTLRFSQQTGRAADDAPLYIDLRAELPPCHFWREISCMPPVKLTVYSVDPGDPTNPYVEFKGMVTDVIFNPSGIAGICRLIAGGPKFLLARRAGMKLEAYCQHGRFGDAGCKKDLSGLTYSGVVLAVDGTDARLITVSIAGTAPSLADSAWRHGRAQVGDQIIEIRKSNGDSTFNLLRPAPTLWITPAWQAGQAYAVGAYVRPTTANGLRYEQTGTAGTSGGSEPTWPTTVGNTVSDNGMTWTCRQGDLTLIEGCDRSPDRCDALNNTINFAGPGKNMPLANPVYETQGAKA